MSKRTYELDMAKGPILRNIILFTLPLIAGNLLQLLYNAADMIVVSRWAGSNAMASVGATGSLSTLIINICIGLSVGASVIVSRRYGAGDSDGVGKAVHTAMLVGVISGIIALFVGIALSKPLLTLMGTPEGEVLDGAVLYMRLFFAGAPASMTYNFGSAVLRSVGDTKRPLYILAATGVVNVVLNLVFVIKFHMGVAGVAVATMVANYLSAIAVVCILMRADAAYKLYISKLKIHMQEFKEILRVGIPSGLQSSMFSIANTVIQSTVNSFGAAAIAGCAAGANIEGFVYTAMDAFHAATLTAVSQNYGAKEEKRIYKSIITSVCCVTVVGFGLGLLTVIFARQLLGVYITDSAEAIEFGRVRMIVTGLPYFLCGIMNVMTGALRGIGYSSSATVNSIVGACGFRLLWIIFALPFQRSAGMLFLCWPLSWLLTIGLHVLRFVLASKKAMAKMNET